MTNIVDLINEFAPALWLLMMILFVLFIVILAELFSRWLHDPARCPHNRWIGNMYHELRCGRCGLPHATFLRQGKARLYAKQTAEEFAENNRQTGNTKNTKWRGRLR